jgi:aminoglycoside N3'-acetyltransferase
MRVVEPESWSVEHLVADLRGLGVGAGELLMVHASLRAIGPVAGGADGVLDALEAAVGPRGTVLMPLGADDDVTPFDALTTPADPEVGTLAEVFRTRPRTIVSDHPEGRFGASGPVAEALTEQVPWDDYYGPGSPLDRFVQAGGRVLRLGADLDTLTLLHLAEYVVPLPDKRRVRRERIVAGRDGPELRTVSCHDDSDGIVDRPGEDYFARILRAYLETGRAATGTVGRATSEILDARDVLEFGVQWMTDNLG